MGGRDARNGRLVTCGNTLGGKATLDLNVLFGESGDVYFGDNAVAPQNPSFAGYTAGRNQ